MPEKSVFFINNHTPLLGYKIAIISIRYPTILFDLIDKVKMSIYRLSMTSLLVTITFTSPEIFLLAVKIDNIKCTRIVNFCFNINNDFFLKCDLSLECKIN